MPDTEIKTYVQSVLAFLHKKLQTIMYSPSAPRLAYYDITLQISLGSILL